MRGEGAYLKFREDEYHELGGERLMKDGQLQARSIESTTCVCRLAQRGKHVPGSRDFATRHVTYVRLLLHTHLLALRVYCGLPCVWPGFLACVYATWLLWRPTALT